MPTYDTGPSLQHLAAIQKWKKHFNAKGCSQSKVFVLARKYALKETRSLNTK
jgi:hypothetical protein